MDSKAGGSGWKRMRQRAGEKYGLARDRFNVIHPNQPLACEAVRIRILPQVGFCMGVHEIRVAFDQSSRRDVR